MKFDDYLQEQLKDEQFKKEWDDIQPEMDVIRAMIDARIEQNLTQKELAARTGINQADISKLENGTRNPSLKLLKRLAHGMGMQLKIEFVPMPKQSRKQRISVRQKERYEELAEKQSDYDYETLANKLDAELNKIYNKVND